MSNGVIRLTESYGPDRLNVGEWFLPAGDDIAPSVVLIHGGFWRKRYDRHLEDKVALDLAARGYLCWNIDYRPSSTRWPTTMSDAAAAYDHLWLGRFADRVDPSRVAVVGHSAGGHLAAWLASRHRLPPEAPGHNPDLRKPTLAIPQAGVVSLAIAAELNLGSGAPQALLDGMPAEHPQSYALADPIALLPTGVRTVLMHSHGDDVVPISQSETYVREATKAGDDSTLVVVPGGHFPHLDPDTDAVAALRDALATM